MWSRRRFVKTLSAGVFSAFDAISAPERGRVKIADIRTMVVQGPRSYLFVSVVTDSGVAGIGEAYGSPAVGVREAIQEIRSNLIGKDPLDIETLYVGLGARTDGSAHMLLRAVSGVEIALWDLAGKLLGVPVSTLLGGRFRDRVRMYHDEGPADPMDRSSCRDWADRMKSSPAGWTAFKFEPVRAKPSIDKVRDPSNRLLTSRELREIRKGFENCRDAIGSDYDVIVHCHWEYDLRTSIQLAEAVEPVKPLFLEDPMPPDFSQGWVDLCRASKVPICTGENLARRHGFKDFIVQHGCDIAQLDIRNTGGLLESKKIADLADLYYIPMCAHNTGSILSTMATVQWAASVRDFLACETVVGRGNWMDDLIVHDGPIVKNGHIDVPAKPGLGVELNREVVKSNLARGEKYWD
ncbi:MAG: mandelate racemase/muconate lactonizing enzyme family protein [Bryobacteraceae bacterium]